MDSRFGEEEEEEPTGTSARRIGAAARTRTAG